MDIAYVVQLAVTPVFLLSGVGIMLTVFTNRLARIVDRSRVLEAMLQSAALPDGLSIHRELETLSRRVRIVDAAIASSTLTGLLVCVVVGALFLGLIGRQLTAPVAVLFVLAMLSFATAFVLFLFEVLIGTAQVSRSRLQRGAPRAILWQMNLARQKTANSQPDTFSGEA